MATAKSEYTAEEGTTQGPHRHCKGGSKIDFPSVYTGVYNKNNKYAFHKHAYFKRPINMGRLNNTKVRTYMGMLSVIIDYFKTAVEINSICRLMWAIQYPTNTDINFDADLRVEDAKMVLFVYCFCHRMVFVPSFVTAVLAICKVEDRDTLYNDCGQLLEFAIRPEPPEKERFEDESFA